MIRQQHLVLEGQKIKGLRGAPPLLLGRLVFDPNLQSCPVQRQRVGL